MKEAALSPSTNRPVPLEGEIEVLVHSKVHLDDMEDGIIRLSTHRLVWLDEQMTRALQLPHAQVTRVEPHSSFGWHRKHQLLVHAGESRFVLEFEEGSRERDRALQSYDKALKDKLWQVEEHHSQFSSRHAGISGLIRKVEQRVKEDEKNVASAFSDMEELGAKAKELVRLAERYKAQQRKEGDEGRDDDDDDDKEVSSLLFGMGIASPITKESAGSLYHEELAREMAGFLPELIQASGGGGGMMALPDVYCVVNRARGTQLVSPDDLYQSAQLFEGLRLPLRLREFKSGVRVIALATQRQESSDEALLALCEKLGHVSAPSVAQHMGGSVALALEECLAAEQSGALCRDSSLRGLLFYANPWK